MFPGNTFLYRRSKRGKGDRYIEKYIYQNSQLNPWKNREVSIEELIDSMKGQRKFMKEMLKRKGRK